MQTFLELITQLLEKKGMLAVGECLLVYKITLIARNYESRISR